MKKFMQTKLKNEKGMTLIELLAVIVILAIIAAIAIPAIGNIIDNSRVGAIKSDAQNIIAAAELYYTDNPGAATVVALSTLKTGGYLDNAGSFDATTATFTSVTKGAGSTPATISAKGVVGGISLTFASATRANITAVPNNVANGSTANNVTVSR